jgi:hypothetical protein
MNIAPELLRPSLVAIHHVVKGGRNLTTRQLTVLGERESPPSKRTSQVVEKSLGVFFQHT